MATIVLLVIELQLDGAYAASNGHANKLEVDTTVEVRASGLARARLVRAEGQPLVGGDCEPTVDNCWCKPGWCGPIVFPGSANESGGMHPLPAHIPLGEIYVPTDRLNAETDDVIDEDLEDEQERNGHFVHEHNVSDDGDLSLIVHSTPPPGGYCYHRRRNYDGCKEWVTTADGVPEEIIDHQIQASDSRRRCQTSLDCEVDNIDGDFTGDFTEDSAHRRRCNGYCR